MPRSGAKAVLDSRQLEAFLDVAEGSKWRLLFELLALSGLRLGEALRWEDVRLSSDELRVVRSVRKVAGEWVYTPPRR